MRAVRWMFTSAWILVALPAISQDGDTLIVTIPAGIKPAVTFSTGERPLKQDKDSLHFQNGTWVVKIASAQPVNLIFSNVAGDPKSTPLKVTADTVIVVAKNTLGNTGFVFGKEFRLQVLSDNAAKDKLAELQRVAVSDAPAVAEAEPAPGEKANKPKAPPGPPFIDGAMLSSVRDAGNCAGLCNREALIKDRKERQYPTDYYIRFDMSRKMDDYTICKHIYERLKSGEIEKAGLDARGEKPALRERYRRVESQWFAPKVHTQLKFEVVNFPLLDRSKITVSENDLFIDNSQLRDILNTQLAATVMKNAAAQAAETPPVAPGKTDTTAGAQTGELEEDNDKLNRLFAELGNYVRSFNLSSCTIEANGKNMVLLKMNIARQFGFEDTVDVLRQLTMKFEDEPQKSIARSVVDLVNGLLEVKPLVYTTPSLVNRDYLNVKVTNAENEVVGEQNIRMSLGLKIDFSAGVFFTHLKDHDYIFKDTTLKYRPGGDPDAAERDTSGRMIIRERNGSLNVGFGLLTHVYPRVSRNYNAGLTVGFMSTPNLDLNVVAGGSIMFQSLFGTNTRVSVSGGVIWGKVQRLSNSVYEGNKLINGEPVFYPETMNTPPRVTVWDHSGFFAFTFNF